MTTSIEWTDATWNPVTGCDKISPGCKNCYAEGIADRFFAKQYPPNGDGSPRKFTDVRCHPDRLEQPLHWKKPRMVFVNSMSDLFHQDVPDEFIDKILGVMCEATKHTFQVLTKRPQRMRDYLMNVSADRLRSATANRPPDGMLHSWPFRNIWWGISVENQKYANERIPLLLQTPAAVRFLSVEPMLEAVDLTAIRRTHAEGFMRPLDGRFRTIDWVICGGESGPGARPFNLAWAESLLEQCRAAGVPFFMKQVGSSPFLRREKSAIGVRVPGGTMSFASLQYESSIETSDRKGGDPVEWPEYLRVREWPK